MGILEDDEFEERPVDLKTFVTSKDYMGLPPLSELQYKLVEKMTQIYKLETLVKLYGEEGRHKHAGTVNEIIAMLGKGSGKDFCSTIAAARVVYLLLCLKDPAVYYGNAHGDAIDLLNIAINADQAKNVFFNPLKQRIQNCPWFDGKYVARASEIEFDKNIRVFSGHSEREGWEGYNLIFCTLDEIAGFAIENSSGNEQAKTADAIYKMYRGSVTSRFPDYGKLILLSFPRFKGDFITQRYEKVVKEVHVRKYSHKFKLHEDLQDGIEDNEFTVEWTEDEIISYTEPGIFAIKRPSFRVNPLRKIEHYKRDLFSDPVDTLSRFFCLPPDAVDAMFKDQEAVKASFPQKPSPFTAGWAFEEWFKPVESADYFMHVDLAEKHDRAAVALCHVADWVKVRYGSQWEETGPVVVVDAVRWWTPTSDKNIDFREIKDYIVSLYRRGFNIKLCTFDQWNSIDMMRELKQYGIDSERLSVNKQHYTDLGMLMYEQRLRGYYIDILLDELLGLRIIKGDKVDHPKKGSNDLADAVCGAAHNAAKLSKRIDNKEIEVQYLEPSKLLVPEQPKPKPSSPPPREIQDFLERLQLI